METTTQDGLPAGEPDASSTPVSDLHEILFDLLATDAAGEPQQLEERIEELEKQYRGVVYSELVLLLAGLTFEPDEARVHWRRVLAHRESLRESVGKPVDLRVAVVSYFVELNHLRKNPAVVTLRLFERALGSPFRDELTGVHNLSYGREHLAHEIRRSGTQGLPLSLILADVDDFNSFNERNGYEAGNEALRSIAGTVVDTLRQADIVARHSGGKFLVILPLAPKLEAMAVARRIGKRVYGLGLKNERRNLTLSMGIAAFPADGDNVQTLTEHARRALYGAKNRGRNQVYLYGQDRRSYRRIKASLDGKLCIMAAEYRPVTTVDLSEHGVLFLVDEALPIGSLIDVTLTLSSRRKIQSPGRVVRVQQKDDGKFETAIRIIDISARHRDLLADFLRQAGDD